MFDFHWKERQCNFQLSPPRRPIPAPKKPKGILDVMPLVRDAIDAERRLVRAIRVFVSSTGDVRKEQILADRLIRSIAAEFNLRVSASESNFQRLAEESAEPETDPENHGALVLCPYFWEYQRVGLDADYQGQIPNIAAFDLVICILWSRLGALPEATLRLPNGSAPCSGTEYEIAWAFRGLNVFDFEHAPIFHGRTKAIGEVLEALEAQVRAQRPFVLVVGASGSGKSSLVRAGVLPLLTQPGTIEGIGLWRRAVTRPGAGGRGGDCFDALAAA